MPFGSPVCSVCGYIIATLVLPVALSVPLSLYVALSTLCPACGSLVLYVAIS